MPDDLRTAAAADVADLVADAGEDGTLGLVGYEDKPLSVRVVLGVPAGIQGQDAGILHEGAQVTARMVQSAIVTAIRDATGNGRWPAMGDLLTVRGQEFAVTGCMALLGDSIRLTMTAGRSVGAGAVR